MSRACAGGGERAAAAARGERAVAVGECAPAAVVGGGGAQFYFNVFQEGVEKAAKGGANVMGTFSEGQLTRVVPDAFADGANAAPEDDANDDENAGDAANDGDVKDAMATAMAAAEAAAKAADVAGPEDEAAARAALANAREALRVALLRAGSDGDGETTDGETTDGDVTDDDVPGSAPPVSEFGATWMMMDGWVTRATFAHVAGEETGFRVQAIQAKGLDDESEAFDSPELPPRGGFASQMSDAAATNISRALPGVCASLGLRASASALERPLGKLLRTFFFRSAAPSLRPARWAFVTAILLEAAAWRMARETSEGQMPPALVEDIARAVADGSMAKVETAAGATCEERETFVQLLRGECAGGR